MELRNTALIVALPISRKVFDPFFLNLSIEERKLNLAEEAAIDLNIVLLTNKNFLNITVKLLFLILDQVFFLMF